MLILAETKRIRPTRSTTYHRLSAGDGLHSKDVGMCIDDRHSEISFSLLFHRIESIFSVFVDAFTKTKKTFWLKALPEIGNHFWRSTVLRQVVDKTVVKSVGMIDIGCKPVAVLLWVRRQMEQFTRGTDVLQ